MLKHLHTKPESNPPYARCNETISKWNGTDLKQINSVELYIMKMNLLGSKLKCIKTISVQRRNEINFFLQVSAAGYYGLLFSHLFI